MAQVSRPAVSAIRADGVFFPDEAGKGVTLALATTYFFVFETADGRFDALSLKWDAAIIFTAQFEETNLPRVLGQDISGAGGNPTVFDVSDIDVVAGNWIIWPMPAAQVSVIATDGTTGGATYVPATGVLTVAGGTAGGARMQLNQIGSRRSRLKVVVGGTGGKLRVGQHAKS